ncbi:bile acid:sodium symporter family protein [Moritella sp. 36]|uniref:bile acid:sodium symporter family protein n=1 Tax=Moritella sp. 36 TaxID=2746233 RepID=UPI001BA6A1F0|nr:bile acid:sodium symporter [Moritella sp. 36]QUM89644.1 bile acid:sodium symporter family protein [Moritella sp. 36]
MENIMLTVGIPIILAWVMFCVGLSLQVADFKHAINFPGKIIAGLLAQLVGLPIIAFLLIQCFSLPQPVAAGLWLLALAPGGASSNAITHLCRGDSALSISMTAFSSLIVPFSIPVLLPIVMPDTVLNMPLKTAVLQLMAVTILPVVLAMLIRHYFSSKIMQRFYAIAERSSLWALCLMVAITVIANGNKMTELFSIAALAVLVLCLLAMLLGILTAKIIHGDKQLSKTFAIEVGIQNAGTAIFVAVVLLQKPELALTPLLYGVLMNIPAALLVLMSKNSHVNQRQAN